jgi:hypothetical protein
MSSQTETLDRMAGAAIPEVDLPEIPLVPLPEKLVSAFDELTDWQNQQQAAFEEWRLAANYILRRGE